MPQIDRAGMLRVDRLAVEHYGITLLQMMENAGRSLARVARQRFLPEVAEACRVTVLAGSGGNGGGAMACARHLANWGVRVSVTLAKASDMLRTVPAHQARILRAMAVPLRGIDELSEAPEPDLIIDGVIGYSLNGPPRGHAAALIEWANRTPSPVLALDLPSGLDADRGVVGDPIVRATATLALGLPKSGLMRAASQPFVGELYLADVGIPPMAYAHRDVGIAVSPMFQDSDVLRLH